MRHHFLAAICALLCTCSAHADIIATFDFDDDVTGLQNTFIDPVFQTTTVGDWTPSLRDTDGDMIGDNEVGGLSGGSDNFFVRSNDGTPNSTNPTTSEAFSSFTVVVSGLAANEVLNLTDVSYDHFGTGIDAGDQFFSRLYTDLTGLSGTDDGIANMPAFDNNAGGTVSESLSSFSALQGLANGDSVTFFLYYGDDQNANGDIHRIDNFVLEGTVGTAIPEPNTMILLFAGCATICFRRKR